jgi:peroxiredoxin
VALPAFAATVPRPAPNLSFSLPNGKTVSLNDYKGKVVAVEVLMTTCPACQRTSGTMQKLYQELGPKGFQPLGLAINDTTGALVPAFVRDQGLSYPVGFGDRDKAMAFLQHSMMMTLMVPQVVIVDKDGTIRAQLDGTNDFFRNEEANLRKLVESLLAE